MANYHVWWPAELLYHAQAWLVGVHVWYGLPGGSRRVGLVQRGDARTMVLQELLHGWPEDGHPQPGLIATRVQDYGHDYVQVTVAGIQGMFNVPRDLVDQLQTYTVTGDDPRPHPERVGLPDSLLPAQAALLPYPPRQLVPLEGPPRRRLTFSQAQEPAPEVTHQFIGVDWAVNPPEFNLLGEDSDSSSAAFADAMAATDETADQSIAAFLAEEFPDAVTIDHNNDQVYFIGQRETVGVSIRYITNDGVPRAAPFPPVFAIHLNGMNLRMPDSHQPTTRNQLMSLLFGLGIART